jgi:hypothetical protein
MAVRFAISSGNWSTGSTWDSFAQLGFPTAADDVWANSYTVNMNQSVDVRSLNNSQTPRIVENIATPAMTSNATPSGFVYASSGAEPWRAFDQSTDAWNSATNNTANITYEFPTPKNIKRYAIRAGGTTQRVPQRWSLEASNDNITYTVLQTVTQSFSINAVYISPILANTASFTFYRVNVSAVATLNNIVQIAEIELTESTGSGAGNLSGGSFNFNSGSISASVAAGIGAGATNLITVTATTGTVNISAPNATVTGIGTAGSIAHSGACDFIITGSSFTAGGNNQNCITKTSSGTINIVGNMVGGVATGFSTYVLSSNNGNTIITGNVTGGTGTGQNPTITQTAGSLIIRGNITGGSGNASLLNHAISFSGTSLTITGSVTGGSGTNAAFGINITSAATVNISGSVIGGTGNNAINTSSNIVLNITGSVIGTATSAIGLSGAAVVNINGPIVAGTSGLGLVSTSTSATNRLTGPFITGPTGIQPFYGPKLTIVTGSATFWTFTSPTVSINKTLYSTDLVSGVPSPSNVRQGVTYASGALVGTMIVPPTSSVAFGVPVDTFTGSAIIAGSNYNISNEIWNTPVTSLTGSSTIGARLSNSATIASTGAQIAALAGR